jgi:hypothetical protein
MPRRTALKRVNLGVYRRVYVSMWLDEKFRGLSQPEPSAQFLWLYLLSGPSTVAVPGVIRATRGGLADELDWNADDLQACFDELTTANMVEVDWRAGVVWLPKAVFYNPPSSANVVKAWAKSLGHITECPLKTKVIKALMTFLSDYGESFRNPLMELFQEQFKEEEQFQEQFRESGAGAGAGTGEPLYPLSEGTVPQTSDVPGSDPAPSRGAGGSDPSPPSAESNPGRESDRVDAESGGDSKSDSTGQPSLFGFGAPEIPKGGTRPPKCTMCGDKVAGVLFRRAGESEPFPGEAVAAMCWGCLNLGCRNDFRLPVPDAQHRRHWKRFEHAFPEHKRLRKRDRERFASEAAARTRKLLEAAGHSAQKVREAQERQAALDAQCKHCRSPAGLVYREIPALQPGDFEWEAGLCPECGGSPLHASPPGFMGPALRSGSGNSGWRPLDKTPAADMDDQAAGNWLKAAVAKAKSRIQAEPTVEKTAQSANEISSVGKQADEISSVSPDSPNEISLVGNGEDPEVGSEDDWDDDVSGEPPPF